MTMKVLFTKTVEAFTLTLNLAPDRMKLFLDVEPHGNHLITKSDLLALIGEQIDPETVDHGVVEDVAKHASAGEKVTERRIRKGTPAVDGADGKILILVKKLSGQADVQVDSKGFADYSSIHLFDNIEKGRIIGRIYPPKSGTDGSDAIGERIPAKVGKPYKFQADKTLTLETAEEEGQSYQTIVAQADGYLKEDGGKLMIIEELVISQDLDYRYGSIKFVGSVRVGGDVLPGFHITARQGIEITGSVRGGSLVCPGGDIRVKGFVFGGKESRVICGRSFYAQVTHQVNAEITGDIHIGKEAIDCRLRAEGAIFISAGQIMGGEAFSVKGLEAKEVGNAAGTHTTINFGSVVEAHTEYARLGTQVLAHDKAKELLLLHLGPLAQHPARIQLLNAPHREKMEKLHMKLTEVENSRIRLLARKKAMLEGATVDEIIRLNYLGTLHEGVRIQAGGEQFVVDVERKGPAAIEYHSAEKRFAEGPVQELPRAAEPQPAAAKKRK